VFAGRQDVHSIQEAAAAATGAASAAGNGEPEALLERARRVFRSGAEALETLAERVGPDFVGAVELLAGCRGRVVVAGIGKSGIIGRKIAATLTSTGTPAIFLHPVEGLHGDLGIVGREDAAILISKSGGSEELTGLVQYLCRLGLPVVALTARPDSPLGRAATVVLDCSVREEACPFDLAPTTSTTATLAMGDALAVALLVRRGFSREDFARLHPGGTLGRKLTLRVADVMLTADLPLLAPDATMRECVVLLAGKRGTVAVVDGAGRLAGVVTAGDLTRLMEREEDVLRVPVRDVMNARPKSTEPEALGSAAVYLMEAHGIMALPVLDARRCVVGMVHLHDLMRAGAV
jgi:arabinose-5-phosphate isomerase